MMGFWSRFSPSNKRFFLNWRSPLLLLLALCFSLISHARFTVNAFPLTDFLESSSPAAQWTKGVWLTNVDSDVLYNPHSLKMAIADLSQTGFNTIYPTVWNDGHTLYPSTVAAELLGTEHHPHPGLADRRFFSRSHPHGKKSWLTGCALV